MGWLSNWIYTLRLPRPVRRIRDHGVGRIDRSDVLRSEELAQALLSMPRERALDWFARSIRTPVTPCWATALLRLTPAFAELRSLSTRSKEHALVVADVLSRCANDGRMPEGGDAGSVNALLAELMQRHPSPRIASAIDDVRWTWPAGERPRQSVRVSAAMMNIARIVLNDDEQRIAAWREGMATQREPVRGQAAVWSALLRFAAEANRAAPINGQWGIEPVVQELTPIARAAALPADWSDVDAGTSHAEVVLAALNRKITATSLEWVGLDEGGDEFFVTLLPRARAEALHALANAVKSDDISVTRF